MKSLLRTVLGWKWIENYAARKVALVAGVAAMGAAAKSKMAMAILAAFGITGDVMTGGLITLSLAALEYLRVSLNDKPEEKK